MDLDFVIERLGDNAEATVRLVAGLSAERARWRPAPGKWSVLEVICHMCDEEREDFRARLESTLDNPSRPWTPIDPEGWVTSRGYRGRDLGEAIADFEAERRASIGWLKTLAGVTPSWERAYDHPEIGAVAAGDLVASWLVHDALHLGQIAGLLAALSEAETSPFSAGYARP